MWKSRYSDINSSSDEKIKIKKGLFGKKVVNMQNEPIRLPKKSKVEFKIQDNGVKLYANNSEISSETFDKIWVDKSNPNIIYASVDGKGTMKIDCTTGKHTPLCEDIRYNKTDAKYCVDMQGNILELNDDCTTTPTGLKKVEEHSDSAHMVCKDENGKYVVLDVISMKPIVDINFENENVSCTLINENKDTPTLRVVANERDHYLVNENYEVLHSIKCDSFSKMHTYNNKIGILRFYDKERNKTTIVNYDKNSNQITEMYEVDNLVCDIEIHNDKTYLITMDKNNKMGVVDKENNTIIPHKYDYIRGTTDIYEPEKVSNSTMHNPLVFITENDDKKGILSAEGQELLPCEYKEIDLQNSIKLDDTYRFFARKENGLWGVINSEGKVELDFIYEDTHSGYMVKNKNNMNTPYFNGYKLRNTVTGQFDYYSKYEKECLLEAKDAIVEHYAPEPKRNQEESVEVPKYSDDEIFIQGVINGFVIDNIPLGIALTDAAMRDQTETKSSTNDKDMEF